MTPEHTILVVEGRKPAAAALAPIVEEQGYTVVTAATRRDALAQVSAANPAVIVLDSPSLRFSSRRFCQTLRDEGQDIPVLLLLAAGEKIDYDIGARIYLHHPFSTKKFLNRLTRLLSDADGDALQVGGLTLDLEHRRVVNSDHESHLTPKQARLLEIFMRHPGEVLPRSYLMRQVWNTDYIGDTRTLEVHIHWIRKAIGHSPDSQVRLTTIRGVGYRLDVDDDGAGQEEEG